MPEAWCVLAGKHAARSAAQPGRRCSERERRAKAESKAEGKIKGRGTSWRERLVCTWEWRGTRGRMAACREVAACRVRIEESACFTRCIAMTLDGAAP